VDPENPEKSRILDIIKKRYSCRRYQSRPVPPDHVRLMKEAVHWAPSACNRQPYRIHFITDSSIIAQIAAAVPLGPASANKWMLTAPMIAAAVGSRELVWHQIPRMLGADYHRTDAVIAMDHLSLAATEAGLGTCWVGWFGRKKVGRILGLARGEEVVILMTVGYPDRDPPKERKRKDPEELFVEEPAKIEN